MNFNESETLKNLTRAFAGECCDGAKYQYLADTANQNNLSEVSTILKGLATNEMAHAKIFYDLINENSNNGVDIIEFKATLPMKNDNFEQMFDIKSKEENRQHDTIYPSFAKTAEKEGFSGISNIFLEISKIERCHAIVLEKLYNMIKNKNLYKFDHKELIKCINCGHEEELKNAWKICPLCSKNKGYIKINL